MLLLLLLLLLLATTSHGSIVPRKNDLFATSQL
jgi:hypothetical protein